MKYYLNLAYLFQPKIAFIILALYSSLFDKQNGYQSSVDLFVFFL